jgi:hypothetical protein
MEERGQLPPPLFIPEIKPTVPIGKGIASALKPIWTIASTNYYSMGTGEILPPGLNWTGREVDQSPPLVKRLVICGAISPLFHTSSWLGAQEKLHLCKNISKRFSPSLQLLKQTLWCEPSAATGMLDDINSTKRWDSLPHASSLVLHKQHGKA